MRRGLESAESAIDYLTGFCSARPATVFSGAPQIRGRFHYNADVSGMNFESGRQPLAECLQRLRRIHADAGAPSLYVGSTDVDLSSVQLTISLGEESGGRTFRDVLGQQLSFLKFFGLDEDAPVDQLDAAQVFQPAREALSITNQIGGTYIILPTLRPFASPAPVPSARLSADDLRAALGRSPRRLSSGHTDAGPGRRRLRRSRLYATPTR